MPQASAAAAAAVVADPRRTSELEVDDRGHDCLSSGEEKEPAVHGKLSSVDPCLLNSRIATVSTSSMQRVNSNHHVVNPPPSRHQHCPLDDTVLDEDILKELSGIMREADLRRLLHEPTQAAATAGVRQGATGTGVSVSVSINDVDIEIVNTSPAPTASLRSSLNRHLILMLTSCGVPHRVFEDMLRDEVDGHPLACVCAIVPFFQRILAHSLHTLTQSYHTHS